MGGRRTEFGGGRQEEEGFLLIGALVAVFLVLLVLSVAAPTVARGLRREREVEAVHRGDEYVRAIRLYYLKFKHYPGSIEQLEKSNNIRFLRQRYADPMTGKADWRIIHLGEQKTTVKGFFGQPLAGLPGAGVGGTSSMNSGTVGGSPGSRGSILGGLGPAPPSTGPAGSTGGAAATGSTADSASSGAGSGSGGMSATSSSGSGGPFVGIGSSAAGESIVVLNEQTTHPTWEFIYDPRIEQMKAKVNLLGGGGGSSSGSGIGGSSPLSLPAPGSPTSPTPPMGSTTPR